MASCLADLQPPIGPLEPDAPDTCADHRRDGAFAVRLGLAGVKTIGTADAEKIVEQRTLHGPYVDMAELVRRTGLTIPQVESLATAGVFDCFGHTRRQALWEAGHAAEEHPDRFAGVTVLAPPPALPGMSITELTMADLASTGVSTGEHPIEHLRAQLTSDGGAGLVLAVTVLAFVAVVVLALTGHALTAGVIGTVWAATCGVLGYKRS
jgi:error-prone DNA polymerase